MVFLSRGQISCFHAALAFVMLTAAPGGELPAGTIGSCNFTYQSQLYSASERILDFFEQYPKR